MTILVTGATGNIGRLVVDHLINLGANDIRALTMNPAKADLPDGVATFTGYLGAPESLPAAFDGVDRMYLAPLPRTLDATLELAKQANIDYVVALSGVGYWQAHADAISASGLANTQLGPGEFLENLALWADAIKTTGTVRDPYPNAVEAPISMDDIARVAAALLISPEQSHHGRMYEITGPQSLTRAQIAEQIGVGIGTEVAFEPCSRDEAIEALQPAIGAEAGWYLDTVALAVDAPQQANQLVADLTGVPAQSVADWARQNATLFR
ncbi:NAD(P)H-binding protein [Mycobacterium sp. 2YAF39]|uniref:NAD(P)H-binding protein n=1 Tax=Mycobacterium sp. 2YAF39 TaxID=3233033 RepID=UPI003F983487